MPIHYFPVAVKLKKNHSFLIPVTDNSNMEPRCSLGCKYLTFHDYKDLLWTTLAEFPGDVWLARSFVMMFFIY